MKVDLRNVCVWSVVTERAECWLSVKVALGNVCGLLLLSVSGVASIGPGRALARPLISQVGPGQARFGCFDDCCLSENNYFDRLNFTFDCHDYIAVTHNRNCNRLSFLQLQAPMYVHRGLYVFICSRIITSLSYRSLR